MRRLRAADSCGSQKARVSGGERAWSTNGSAATCSQADSSSPAVREGGRM